MPILVLSAADMLAASSLGLFCISVGASALGGALGMASGIFTVPILTVVVGVDIHVAIGASIVSVIGCSCGSAAPFLQERLTNVRLAIVLETATTLRAACCCPEWFRLRFSTRFATVFLVSAWQMHRRRPSSPLTEIRLEAGAHRLDAVYSNRTLGRDVA